MDQNVTEVETLEETEQVEAVQEVGDLETNNKITTEQVMKMQRMINGIANHLDSKNKRQAKARAKSHRQKLSRKQNRKRK